LEIVIHFKIKSAIYFEKNKQICCFFRQQNLATLGGSGVV